MNNLNEFPQWADNALGGLKADDKLKYRILQAAKEQPQTRKAPRWTYAVGTCLAAAVIVVGGIGLNMQQKSSEPVAPIISTRAGVSAEEKLDTFADEVFVASGYVEEADSVAPASTLWAQDDQADVPVISVNGRCYRMLTTPMDVPVALLGNQLAKVESFTADASLQPSNTVFSNVVHADMPVYAIPGMENTLVAAQVNDHMRLFQRVSFNGHALVGREKLADVLQISGRVVMMTDEQGRCIFDQDVIDSLVATLFADAVYEAPGHIQGSRCLQLTLDNGLMLQLDIDRDSVSACGTWSCPEFINQLESALQ
ncbi:MAG: hypothetical protein Q4C54_09440 [Clostridia bacterium]|nr:hypothetical protein [Clostridia bacterium]